jgi:hypothetical protein
MSYYTVRARQLVIENFESISLSWPASLAMTAVLSPAELFQEPEPNTPRAVTVGPVEIDIDGLTGKLTARPRDRIPLAEMRATTPVGALTIRGNNVTIQSSVNSIDEVLACADYLSTNVARYLSVEVGLFVDAVSISGTLAGHRLSLLYPGGSYGLTLLAMGGDYRQKAIERALARPPPGSASFPRFAASCFYYHQALRLRSPHEVTCSYYVVHAEIMLNLAKALVILMGTDDHDELRKRFGLMGYERDQIESQLIPILLMRNQTDVGHATAARPPEEHLAVYHTYIDRAVNNVGAVLRRTATLIRADDALLAPLDKLDPDREKFVLRLREHLSQPEL